MIPKLHGEVQTLHDGSIDAKFLSESSNMYEMIEDLDKKWVQFQELSERSIKYNEWQEVLGTPSTAFDNIESLREELFNRRLMWHSLKEWEEMTDKWVKTNFGEINAEEISGASEKYNRITNKLGNQLPTNAI